MSTVLYRGEVGLSIEDAKDLNLRAESEKF